MYLQLKVTVFFFIGYLAGTFCIDYSQIPISCQQVATSCIIGGEYSHIKVYRAEVCCFTVVVISIYVMIFVLYFENGELYKKTPNISYSVVKN